MIPDFNIYIKNIKMNKVLIVDDDVDNAVIQQTIVQKLGFYTQIAITGHYAINISLKLREHKRTC